MDASPCVARATVIGVGNEYRRDDGVGWAVVACLARRGKRRPLPRGVGLTCTDGDPARLISAWGDVRLAILVDAAHARPARPGRVHRLRFPGELPSTPHGEAGSHGFPLDATLRLARALDRLPEELLVYAVEATDTGLGTRMSPQVAAAVEPLAQRIEEDLLRHFGSGQ
ncbi:hydrogenase maturation protease [Streptomyces sp. NPDC021749]|uniref:hydrogenase maturation protease n=1 Tax=Streptomyces sp. NPDC021749 TaxID=3154905 RepID=UPI0033EC2256